MDNSEIFEHSNIIETHVHIPVNTVYVEGTLAVPKESKGAVIFAHGSGSSRFSPRNVFVARQLQNSNMVTLLFDLLTQEEDQVYKNRFDIDLLTKRLMLAIQWAKDQPQTKDLHIGLFGASTGATAALRAASQLGDQIKVVVSRGGRPDLAMEYLPFVEAPVLLLVGEYDKPVIDLNQKALEMLKSAKHKELIIIPKATHLFEEPGALEEVASLAVDWFRKYLG